MKQTQNLRVQMHRRPLMSLTLAFFAVISIWSVLTPLFAGPDEPANYIKGAAIVRGVLVGEDVAPTPALSYWSTRVEIPYEYGVAMQVPWCFVPMPDTPACDRPMESLTPEEKPITNMGRYPPIGFVASGIGSLVGPTDLSVRFGRLLNAGLNAFLLALGCTLLLSSGRSAIVVLAATTPGVLFLASVISPSGIEIAASICLWAAMYPILTTDNRLASNSVKPKRLTLAKFGFALSGSLIILARPTGIFFYLVTITICLLASSSITKLRECIGALTIPLAVHILSISLSILWYFRVYNDHLGQPVVDQQTLPTLVTIIEQSLNDLSAKIGESIGNYGWLDTPTPTFAVWFCIILIGFVVLRSWPTITIRNRIATLGLALLIPVFMIFLNRNYQSLLASYGVQGRHLTPLFVGIPLVAGVTWKPQRKWLRLIIFGWSLSVFASGVFALRRYVVGIQPQNFHRMISAPVWQPVLGVFGTLLALTSALGFFSVIFYSVATTSVEPSAKTG